MAQWTDTLSKIIINAQNTKPRGSVLQNIQNFLHHKGLWTLIWIHTAELLFYQLQQYSLLNIGVGCPFKLAASMGSSAGIHNPAACAQNKQLSQQTASAAE